MARRGRAKAAAVGVLAFLECVAHLVAEDNHIFANTKHVNSWQFYHNWFSQLTREPTIK